MFTKKVTVWPLYFSDTFEKRGLLFLVSDIRVSSAVQKTLRTMCMPSSYSQQKGSLLFQSTLVYHSRLSLVKT